MERDAVRHALARRGTRAVRAVRRHRPEWLVSRRRPGAFTIAHVGRSGSTVLGDLLGQHPRVQWDGETYGKRFHELVLEGRADQRRHIALSGLLAQEMRAVGPGWFGFDFLMAHLQRTGTSVSDHAADLRRAGFSHFVLLRRENVLRVEVSGRLADASGLWHSTRNSEPGSASVMLDLSPDDEHGTRLLRRLRSLDRFHGELLAEHRDDAVLELVFERDIEADPRVAYDKVIRFLGLAPHEPHVRLRRLNRRPIAQLIENHQEVVEALTGSEFEWMLDDAGPSERR